jgi:hypothetical protein
VNRLHRINRVVRRTAVTVAFGSALVATSGAGAAPIQSPFPLQSTTVQGAGAAQRQLYGGTPKGALARFRIDYTKGWDTAVRDIGVELTGMVQARGWLADDDGRSPLTLRAKWRDMTKSSKLEHRKLSAKCSANKCRIGTLDHGSDDVPLLAGFVFHNLAGARKIKRLAVYPERRTGPNRQVTYYARLEGDGPKRYTVDIDVIVVDPSVIAGQYSATASSEPNKPYAAVPLEWKNGTLVLQGFDVRYKNGAHHLQELAIEPLKGTNAVKAVYFSDKNDDDPIQATLWWADLKAPGIKVIPMDKPLPQQQPKNPGPAPQLDPAAKGGTKTTLPKMPTKKFPGPAPTPKF